MIIDVARNYTGLTTDNEHANEVRAKKQANINKWLRGWQQVYRHIWWLYQQYGDETITFRIMGSNTVHPQEFHKNPTEDFDFYLEFDALSQEPELQREKIKSAIDLFSAADRNARGDWDALLQKGVEIIDPTWVETMIKPEEQALQDEMKQERDMLTRMFSGSDEDLPEQGVNTQLRRQVVQQFIQGSENIPATDVQNRLQNEEDPFRARLEKHMAQLDFIDQQRENAQIGRIGTPPGNMTAR